MLFSSVPVSRDSEPAVLLRWKKKYDVFIQKNSRCCSFTASTSALYIIITISLFVTASMSLEEFSIFATD